MHLTAEENIKNGKKDIIRKNAAWAEKALTLSVFNFFENELIRRIRDRIMVFLLFGFSGVVILPGNLFPF